MGTDSVTGASCATAPCLRLTVRSKSRKKRIPGSCSRTRPSLQSVGSTVTPKKLARISSKSALLISTALKAPSIFEVSPCQDRAA